MIKQMLQLSRRRVSLVVAAVDAFSGARSIAGQMELSIGGMKPPVKKDDAFFVFTEPLPDEFLLRVRSPIYRAREMMIRAADLPPALPFRPLLLEPNERYPFPAHTTYLRGRSAPGSRIAIYCRQHPDRRILRSDVRKNGTEIELSSPLRHICAGQLHCILQAEGGGELCTLAEVLAVAQGRYRLETPLAANHAEGAHIVPAFATTSDEEGNYFLPFLFPAAKTTIPFTACYFTAGKPAKSVELHLFLGKDNRADLIGQSRKKPRKAMTHDES